MGPIEMLNYKYIVYSNIELVVEEFELEHMKSLR